MVGLLDVIVPDGDLLAEGSNEPISTNDPTAHAGIVGIRRAPDELRNYRLAAATLYVTVLEADCRDVINASSKAAARKRREQA